MRMDIKQYLSKAHSLDQRINDKLSQKENIKCQAMKITASYSDIKVGSTKQKSPMENAIVRMVMLEQEINNDIDMLYSLKTEIELLVLEIEDPLYRAIINQRYIKNKSWEEIAEVLGYQVRWVLKLHNRALKEAEKIMLKNLKKDCLVTNLIMDTETNAVAGS
jgi:DNA-directed RNA polymerase specialized sigma subunit